MDALKLAEYLLKELRQRKERMSGALLDGSITSMEEYRFVIGQIRGMTYAEDEIKTAMKGMELEDD